MYTAVVPTGIFGMACLTSLAGWRTTVACQAAFLASTLLPALRIDMSADAWDARKGLMATVSMAVSALGLLLVVLNATTMPLCIAGALISGYASSGLRRLWYSQHMLIYERRGRLRCAQTAMASYLPAAFLVMAFPLVAGSPMLVGVFQVSALAVSLACALCGQALRPGGRPRGRFVGERPYVLSTYSAALLAVFGLTWGIACAEIARASWRQGHAHVLPWLVGAALVLAFAIVAVSTRRGSGSARRSSFGYRTRCVVALAGGVWVSAPLLSVVSPDVLLVMVIAVYMVQFMLMLMFSAEISSEGNIPLEQVAAKNCGVFYGCTVIGVIVYAVVGSLVAQGHLAYDVLALVAAVPALALMPLLPSRTSSASTFTMSELPEEESLDARLEVGRRALVEVCGLTDREAEVADLLIEGCTRAGIAERLRLSPWTVKTHTTSIYKKVGVHSNKELLRKLEDMGSGR